MKRAGNLYGAIADPDNLRLAFWKAKRGKAGKPDVEAFRADLGRKLEDLRGELLAGDIRVGECHTFTIHDPKERLICAPSFRERVLHHAVVNVCEPVFERRQIHDSYACRKGKGLHACLERAKRFTRYHDWYLKLDVRKYFDSIPHDRLRALLRRRFKDRLLLALLERIIDSHSAGTGKGIPIGSLTSQHFANDYLSEADHMVKEAWSIRGYVRYMDDLVLWHDDKAALLRVERQLREFCRDALALELKPPCLNHTAKGVSMLGYRVFPDRVLLARRSRRRFVRKLGGYWQMVSDGQWSQGEFAAHALPLVSYVGHADSASFRRRIMEDIGCSP